MSRHAAIGESKSRLSAQSGTPAECFRSRDSGGYLNRFCTRLRLKPLAAGHLEANPLVKAVSGDFGIGKT